MKITTTILILSTLLLVGCNEAKDTTPLAKTPEPVTVQAEAENDVVPVSWNEVSEQTPEDTLKIESQTKTETNLWNF